MERKVTKLEHSHVEVVVVADEKTWKDAQDKAFKDLAKNVTVDGFRKGKAPANLVKGKVDPMKVMDNAINALIPVMYREIVEEEGIKPYVQPKVDVTKVSDKEVEVKFTLVTAPVIELGAYKGLELGKEEPTVTDEDVENAVQATLKQNATLVVKEGASAMGDTVVIDFVGSIDGVEFEGGSAENHELELGSHQFIPGFEEQLVGKTAGEDVTVNVKFPENYTEELKGKDAVFACKVHEVKEKKVPELNDEFVKDLGIAGVETVEALKENKKNEVLTRKQNEARRDYMGKLFDTIAKDSKVDIPEEIIDAQVASRKKDLENRMQQSGLTLEQYLQIVGQKEEDLVNNLKVEATRDVTNYMILEQVAAKENMVVTDADLEAEYAKIAEQYKMEIENVKKALAAQLEEFRNNLQMQHVEDFLFENNK